VTDKELEVQANDSSADRNQLVGELSEDLAVAIQEFVERHPHSEPRRIRRALRLVERQLGVGWPRVGPMLRLAAAFVAGWVTGALLR